MSQSAAAVVIPTRNRKDLLRKAIASALAQTVPVEVFIMDDASSDATGEMVRAEFPNVTYCRSEVNIGPTGQRNRGAALASAPFLVTLDDDCVLQSPRTIEQTIRLFDSPSIGAVTIPYVNVLQDQVVRGGASYLYFQCNSSGLSAGTYYATLSLEIDSTVVSELQIAFTVT